MKSRIYSAVLVLAMFWHTIPAALPASAAPALAPSARLALVKAPRAGCMDFNGDGKDDLAIGVTGAAMGGHDQAGQVNVLYGSTSLLTGVGDQVWHQNVAGVPGGAELEDHFGAALAGGDFNNDGFCDLAIGVPGEMVGNVWAAGAVNILYGSSTGLTATGSQIFHQGTDGPDGDVDGDPEAYDNFGAALAAGDFNSDGYDDLAIGVPGESVNGHDKAGAVNVLYGGSQRLRANPDDFWHQDQSGVDGDAEAGDQFGFSLAAGDFDGDGDADLAIGVPYENINGKDNVGAVNVLYGSQPTLTANPDDFWHQGVDGPDGDVDGDPEAWDTFGYALAAGDFNGDGFADLAIGVPFESVNGLDNAGAVNVIYGSRTGLLANPDQLYHQATPGLDGDAEAQDRFGRALAAGDFDGNGYDDLAIGVPYESVNGHANAGAVNVLAGAAGGLTPNPDEFWHQDQPGVDFDAEANDQFGAALTAGDFDGDGRADLVIGVPHESVVGIGLDVGAINVLAGSSTLLTENPDQVWYRDNDGAAKGVKGQAVQYDLFGQSLSR